jgi:hypothetical protein
MGITGSRVSQICERARRVEKWLPNETEVWLGTEDAVYAQWVASGEAEKKTARRQVLQRPVDMGGPRDMWIEASPWDER